MDIQRLEHDDYVNIGTHDRFDGFDRGDIGRPEQPDWSDELDAKQFGDFDPAQRVGKEG